MLRGVLVLVSVAMFCGVIKGSADTIPVLIVPVEGGYQLQVAGSVLMTQRKIAKVFFSLDAVHRFCMRCIAPACGRAFVLQLRIDAASLF